MAKEYLKWRAHPQALAGPKVQAVHDEQLLLGGQCGQVTVLGQVLADEAFGVLVRPPLPRGIGMGEVEINAQRRGNGLMASKLTAIVGSDRGPMAHAGEQVHNGLRDLLSRLRGNSPDEGEARLALGERDQRSGMSLADHQVHLPISQPAAQVYHRWTLLDAGLPRDLASAVIVSITFAALLLATQVAVQVASTAFVGIDILINALMAQLRASLAPP